MNLPNDKQKKIIAKTKTNALIELYCFGVGKLKALLVGGVHGDESEGFLLAEEYIINLQNGKIKLNPNIQLFVCPRLNPDGCENLRRTNHNNVDLNRNLPTKDWEKNFKNPRYFPGSKASSEIETKTTVNIIKKINPKIIISLHSYEKPMVNYNGPCEDLALAISKKNNLIVKSDIGYPTPGSLGTYAGWERKISTITLEILRGQNPPSVWEQHSNALTAAFEFYLEK